MQHLAWPACILALLASGCDSSSNVRISTRASSSSEGGALKVIDALQCPQDQGVLTRKGSASADGRSCLYSGPRGSEVKLHLVDLEGRPPQEALSRFEKALADGLPAAANVAIEATASQAGDVAQVRAPGLSVDAEGDKASVRLPGMRIQADGDRADIRIGGLVIRADDQAGEVRMRSSDGEVDIKADASGARVSSREGEAVRATFVNTSTEPSAAGWRTVGYQARGPVGGPIVVATVRAKDRDADRLMKAAETLVKLNVGD